MNNSYRNRPSTDSRRRAMFALGDSPVLVENLNQLLSAGSKKIQIIAARARRQKVDNGFKKVAICFAFASILSLVSSCQSHARSDDISKLRTPIKNPVYLPLYTIHMQPEFPSTWIFGSEGAPPIPAGFFGRGSDPWRGSISCVGNPLDPEGSVPTADLIVRHEKLEWIPNPEARYGPAEIPRQFVLRCDMVELSERGTEPITVTYDDGKRMEKWDVAIGLAKDHPGGGQIEITRINSDGNGGLADIEIAVKIAFIFKLPDQKKELRIESEVEWLSETRHNFVRWMDPSTSKRFYVSPEMQGSFIPATRNVGGRTQMTVGKSCNRVVSHSFSLSPRIEEIAGRFDAQARAKWGTLEAMAEAKWGTLDAIKQYPRRLESKP